MFNTKEKAKILKNKDTFIKFQDISGRRKANQRIWNDVPTAPE
jgi:ATP-dependent Zn protease